MTITAQLGDLTFSAIKRHYDIKDYSQLNNSYVSLDFTSIML